MPPRVRRARSRQLTIYLVKTGLATDKILKNAEMLGHYSVGTEREIGELYLALGESHAPRWVSLFADETTPALPDILSRPASAVLLVKAAKRIFALTFGYGRHILVPGSYEENFGLVVTLNSVPSDGIRSIDRTSFDAITSHSRTQASREGSLSEFGIDVEQDLLRAVTGTPTDLSLGARLTGMDALHTVLPIDLSSLPDLLQSLLAKYQDRSYRKTYPWIDQIGEIRDPTIVADLDGRLVEKLRAGDLERLWLAPPSIMDWTDIAGFQYSAGGDVYPDLHIRDFIQIHGNNDTLSPDILRSERVSSVSSSTGMDLDKWSLYQCVYCEVDQEGETYLLSAGKWYRLAKSFVTSVNNSVRKLAVKDKSLPPYQAADRNEGGYNQRIANSDPSMFALMDQRLINIGGGHSSVEFCDLFTKTRRMVHVKRYSGSSTLSHLFSQGEIAASLFLAEEAFRLKVIAELPKSHKSLVSRLRPKPHAFEVVYGIVSRSRKPIAEALPFFSRLNLRNRARVLQNYGYNVSLAKIEIA